MTMKRADMTKAPGADVPPVGRFGPHMGGPNQHEVPRALWNIAIPRMTTEELQAAEQAFAHHPDARSWFQSKQPSRTLLKILATIRAELADRGIVITDFPERAHKRGAPSQSPFAKYVECALGPGQFQAAFLTGWRALWSSNWLGLMYPSDECRRLAL